jgi:hypothetical protein
MRLGRPADGFIGQIWSPYIAAKYLFLILMSSSYIKHRICVFPASHLKVHAAIEKGLAHEKSVFADFFCSWRRFLLLATSFFSRGLKDSVAKGPKFQLKNIKGLKNILRGW